VLDLTPPLTPELVKLGRWMSKTYLCHEITALQAMIPGALKAKYERHVRAAAPEERDAAVFLLPRQQEILRFVAEKNSVELEALMQRFSGDGALIRQLIEEGHLVEIQLIKDRMNAKKALTVFPPENVEQLDSWTRELPARANKQKEVL